MKNSWFISGVLCGSACIPSRSFLYNVSVDFIVAKLCRHIYVSVSRFVVHPAEGYSVVFGMTYCLGHYTAKNYLLVFAIEVQYLQAVLFIFFGSCVSVSVALIIIFFIRLVVAGNLRETCLYVHCIS